MLEIQDPPEHLIRSRLPVFIEILNFILQVEAEDRGVPEWESKRKILEIRREEAIRRTTAALIYGQQLSAVSADIMQSSADVSTTASFPPPETPRIEVATPLDVAFDAWFTPTPLATSIFEKMRQITFENIHATYGALSLLSYR